jgi:hypothetical protein
VIDVPVDGLLRDHRKFDALVLHVRRHFHTANCVALT